MICKWSNAKPDCLQDFNHMYGCTGADIQLINLEKNPQTMISFCINIQIYILIQGGNSNTLSEGIA